jgi:hypothetical protein
LVNQGQCTSNFDITTTTINPTCEGVSDGKIIVNSVVGGTSPYTYSINGITYQISNIFLGLEDGTYTVYVKDLIGNISAKLVTLSNQNPITNYQLTLNLVPPNPPVLIATSSRECTYNWEISVTPTLPAGREIDFTIYHTSSFSAGTSAVSTPTLTYNNTTGSTGGGQFVTSSQTQTSNTFTTIGCHPNYYTTGVTRIYTAKIVGTGTVKGQVFMKVVAPNGDANCVSYASINDSITVNGAILLNNGPCETVIPPINALSFGVSKQGFLVNIPVGPNQ